jgi:hypothetical protein
VTVVVREHALDRQRRLHLAEDVPRQAAFDVDAQARPSSGRLTAAEIADGYVELMLA